MVVDGKQRKVLICCFGSRGDVQPFAALARGLQDSNYNVLGMTNINDGTSIFTSLGVSAEGVHFDMAEFLREDPNMKRALETGSALQFGLNMSKQFANRFPTEFKSQWKVANDFQPELIISTTLIWFQASAIGQALRIPVLHADLGPFSFLPISRNTQTEMHEPKWLHKLSSFLMVTAMTMSLKDKNKDGEILLDTMREVLKDAIPKTEHLLGQSAGQHAR